jgi:nicotinate-nucleotide adenylyltransferase
LPAPEHARRERIGILGGTFDPPHLGHVAAAQAVVPALGLDRLLLVVANDPWQKSASRDVSPAEDRFALTEVMAEELPAAEASRLEIDRGGPSYSVDTVEEILARVGHPAPHLFLVVGADLAPELDTWERVGDLQRLVTLAVVSRPNAPVPDLDPAWTVVRVDGPQVEVSSSEVRERLLRGDSVNGLVPEAVIRCIHRRALYAVGR